MKHTVDDLSIRMSVPLCVTPVGLAQQLQALWQDTDALIAKPNLTSKIILFIEGGGVIFARFNF